jgi:hypothetical protein
MIPYGYLSTHLLVHACAFAAVWVYACAWVCVCVGSCVRAFVRLNSVLWVV